MIPIMADSPDETSIPNAWTELIHAFTLLAKHPTNDISPLHCEHDELTVMADPSAFTTQELEYLNHLGFGVNEHENTFYSFRYGSA